MPAPDGCAHAQVAKPGTNCLAIDITTRVTAGQASTAMEGSGWCGWGRFPRRTRSRARARAATLRQTTLHHDDRSTS